MASLSYLFICVLLRVLTQIIGAFSRGLHAGAQSQALLDAVLSQLGKALAAAIDQATAGDASQLPGEAPASQVYARSTQLLRNLQSTLQDAAQQQSAPTSDHQGKAHATQQANGVALQQQQQLHAQHEQERLQHRQQQLQQPQQQQPQQAQPTSA